MSQIRRMKNCYGGTAFRRGEVRSASQMNITPFISCLSDSPVNDPEKNEQYEDQQKTGKSNTLIRLSEFCKLTGMSRYKALKLVASHCLPALRAHHIIYVDPTDYLEK